MKNLLVLSSGYPSEKAPLHTFVKGQVDALSPHFERIVVIAVLPKPPLGLTAFASKRGQEILLKQGLADYQYSNVEVYYLYYNHLPINYFRYRRHKAVFSDVSQLIYRIAFKPNFIHAHFSNPGGMIANRLSKYLNVPYVVTVHESEKWLYQEIEDSEHDLIKGWEDAKFLIRVNEKDLKLLKRFNANVEAIPNGFDPKYFNFERERRIISPRVILNVGFYQPKKGQQYLIEAAKHMVDQGASDFRIKIVGGGALHKTLQSQIDKLDLNHVVELCGMKSHIEIAEMMKESTVFCLSSLSEGNPTVMFEALGSGLPCVCTNVGGVSEILNNSVGLLCESMNSEALAQNLISALNTKWDRNAIKEYGNNFTWGAVANQLIKLFDQ